jgi:hypothetical protein
MKIIHLVRDYSKKLFFIVFKIYEYILKHYIR